MRVLKNDFIKYSRDDDAGDEQEETGWKYIHGDVFRFPRHPSLFAAMVGTGSQLLVRGLTRRRGGGAAVCALAGAGSVRRGTPNTFRVTGDNMRSFARGGQLP